MTFQIKNYIQVKEIFCYTDSRGGRCACFYKDQAEKNRSMDKEYNPSPIVRFIPETELKKALQKIKELEIKLANLDK